MKRSRPKRNCCAGKRELDDAKRSSTSPLSGASSINPEVRQKATLEAEESSRLRVAEKSKQIISMQRQINELKRRAEAGLAAMQARFSNYSLKRRFVRNSL